MSRRGYPNPGYFCSRECAITVVGEDKAFWVSERVAPPASPSGVRHPKVIDGNTFPVGKMYWWLVPVPDLTFEQEEAIFRRVFSRKKKQAASYRGKKGHAKVLEIYGPEFFVRAGRMSHKKAPDKKWQSRAGGLALKEKVDRTDPDYYKRIGRIGGLKKKAFAQTELGRTQLRRAAAMRGAQIVRQMAEAGEINVRGA